jgi:aspartate aminotransferase
MVSEYRRRRDAGLAELRKAPGLRYVHPDGAFYFYVDVSGTSTDSRSHPEGVEVSGTSTDADGDAGGAFCTRLLDEAGVAIVPGSAFHTPGWVRISYAAKLDDVVSGVRAVVELWKRK